MFTRKLTPSAIGAALLLGAFSQQAASEDIVVYGAETLARIEARQAMFRSEMDEYKRSVSELIKVTLQESVKRPAVPKLELASSEEPIRG